MLVKKLRMLQFVSLILFTMLLSSCGSDNSSQGQGNTYKETKSMVLDILKSDDGKKAISTANQSIMNGDLGAKSQGGQSQIKLLSANESLQLQMAVKDVLTAQENNKFLQDMMKDPKFAGDFAKAIQKDTKQMFKELLKDPEYQKALVDVMKNPDYEKMIMDVMKTAAYRQQMMTVMQDAIQSPLFRSQMVDLLKAAIAQQSSPEQTSKSSQKKSDSGGDSGGDSKKDEKSDSKDSKKQDSSQKDDSSSSES